MILRRTRKANFNCVAVSLDNLEVVSTNVPIQAVATQPKAPCKVPDKCIKLTAKADSGCGEHVIPFESLPEIPLQNSPECSTTYRTASGRILGNGGMKSVSGRTVSGDKFTANWQAVPGLKQPLLSLGKLAGHGHKIILDDELPGGGVCIHKASGKQFSLQKVNNTYECELLINAPAAPFTRPAA